VILDHVSVLERGHEKTAEGRVASTVYSIYFFVVFLRFTNAEPATCLAVLLLEGEDKTLLAAVETFEEVLTEFCFFIFSPPFVDGYNAVGRRTA
jgi:hypothetical protein